MSNNEINIREALELFAKGNFIEVRILKVPSQGTVSGYFNDYGMLEKAIRKYNGKNNIFFTLNPLIEDIEARSTNKFQKFAQNTTTDKEIAFREWLLIDIDSKRPAGLSATDEELAFAEEKSLAVQEYLHQQGFPEPIYACSGNGYHLLVPVNLPNDDDSRDLVKSFLKVLGAQFTDEHVEIDQSTFNAARITKLYGTIACKGDNTEKRPHRRSYIISMPKTIVPTPREKIVAVAECGLKDKPNPPVTVENRAKAHLIKGMDKRFPKINVADFCANHGIEISHEKALDTGGTCYVLSQCPWNEEHTDKSAFIIQFTNGKIVAGCHHNSCSNESWETLLKKHGVSDKMQCWGKALKDTDGMSVSDIILAEIKQAGHELYHDPGSNVFVSFINEKGYKQYTAVADRRYSQYIRQMYYQRYGKTINKEALAQVIATLEAEAAYNGDNIETAIRCKYKGGALYYYLADVEQTVLKIDERGIEVLENNEIPFICKAHMLPQVMPMDMEVNEGEIKLNFRRLAKKFWRFKSEDDYILHNIVLLTRFVSDIPSPILYYMGDRGSTKTTSMKLDKMLVDPSNTSIKALPNQINDIIVALSNEYMVCFDNVEGNLNAEKANILCICSSSGYYSKRMLYSDNESVDIQLSTRLAFSGITSISNRADFLDRVVAVFCRRLSPTERKTESEVIEEFKKYMPYLLFRSFKILSKAIKIYKRLDLHELPRMADFARWGYAIAEALKYGGENFLKAYKKNQEELLGMIVEEDALLDVLIAYVKNNNHFKGTATQLMVELTEQSKKMGVDIRHGLAKGTSSLSRKLNQCQSVLKCFGIELERGKSDGERYIEIWEIES